MCLKVKIGCLDDHIPPIHKAGEDIICYKIVKRIGKKYMTPFQDTKISSLTMLGAPFRARGPKWEDIVSSHDKRNEREYTLLYVYDGVIHTMEILDEAIDFANYVRECYVLKKEDGNDVEIWECVVPKGCKYMRGEDANGYSCIGSKMIRFIQRVY